MLALTTKDGSAVSPLIVGGKEDLSQVSTLPLPRPQPHPTPQSAAIHL